MHPERKLLLAVSVRINDEYYRKIGVAGVASTHATHAVPNLEFIHTNAYLPNNSRICITKMLRFAIVIRIVTLASQATPSAHFASRTDQR